MECRMMVSSCSISRTCGADKPTAFYHSSDIGLVKPSPTASLPVGAEPAAIPGWCPGTVRRGIRGGATTVESFEMIARDDPCDPTAALARSAPMTGLVRSGVEAEANRGFGPARVGGGTWGESVAVGLVSLDSSSSPVSMTG